jgi:hypothetical protein
MGELVHSGAAYKSFPMMMRVAPLAAIPGHEGRLSRLDRLNL